MPKWKYIKGVTVPHQVSDDGQVRCPIKMVSGNVVKNWIVTQYEKKSGGFKYVALDTKSGRKNFYVHRLVAEAFVPNPSNLPKVRHHSGSSNVAANLRWCK